MKTFFVVLLFLMANTPQAAQAPPVQDAEITVCWILPTENVDGSPLTDLEALKLHRGTSSRNYTATTDIADISNPEDCLDFVILDIPSGTMYYFAMTALDESGNESAFSNEVDRGPFVVADTVSPRAVSGFSVEARTVRCPPGYECTIENDGIN